MNNKYTTSFFFFQSIPRMNGKHVLKELVREKQISYSMSREKKTLPSLSKKKIYQKIRLSIKQDFYKKKYI